MKKIFGFLLLAVSITFGTLGISRMQANAEEKGTIYVFFGCGTNAANNMCRDACFTNGKCDPSKQARNCCRTGTQSTFSCSSFCRPVTGSDSDADSDADSDSDSGRRNPGGAVAIPYFGQ